MLEEAHQWNIGELRYYMLQYSLFILLFFYFISLFFSTYIDPCATPKFLLWGINKGLSRSILFNVLFVHSDESDVLITN